MKRALAVALCVVIVVILVPGWSQAANTYHIDELPTIIVERDRLLLPITQIHGERGIFIATDLQCDSLGLAFDMPLYEGVFVLTENDDGLLYIQLLKDGDEYETPTGRVVGIETEATDYPGVRVMDDTPEGIARGRQVLIPLINRPVGTDGYVMQIVRDGDSYILPLLQAPKGHTNPRNPHDPYNPWGIEYDATMAVDYEVLRL